ncbi:MAG: hypothetical protein IT234_01115 [Bacteroidia bacterium]|nr:hypothetical protein [Bacteroidia bacterium]
MKKIFLIFAILFAAIGVKSQSITYGSDSKEIMNISKGNLFIILTGDETFDKSFEASVKNYWKQNSSFKTILSKDVEKYLGDANNYFLCLAIRGFDGSYSTIIMGDINTQETQELVLFNGEKSKLSKYTYEMAMITVPMMARKQQNYYLQTDYLVIALNNSVDIVKNENISKQVMYAVLRTLRKDVSVIKNKTLLIDETLVNEKTLSKYKYKYKILPSSEIAKLLEAGSKDYCALAWGINPFKQIFIFDLETKKVVYGISTQGSLGINEKDFVKLSDFIDEKIIEK